MLIYDEPEEVAKSIDEFIKQNIKKKILIKKLNKKLKNFYFLFF